MKTKPKTEKQTTPSATRGRKVGSKKKLTTKGLDLLSNELLAHWGNAGTDGGAWAHQAWIDRHPSASGLAARAALLHTTPDALLAEIQGERLNDHIAAAISAAIDRRDFRFFEDMAATLRRIKADGAIEPYDAAESALLAHIGFHGWNHEYSIPALRADVAWPADKNGVSMRPSPRAMTDLVSKFSIRLKKGRPFKK